MVVYKGGLKNKGYSMKEGYIPQNQRKKILLLSDDIIPNSNQFKCPW